MSSPYDDIINLPHPTSERHPRMPMAARAAQFSPFAALTGYEDDVHETARLTSSRAELTEEEKEQAGRDMSNMLDYIDLMGELDTTGVEPMTHVFPVQNVFREDVETNGDGSRQTLQNAPEQKDNMFKVPRIFE